MCLFIAPMTTTLQQPRRTREEIEAALEAARQQRYARRRFQRDVRQVACAQVGLSFVPVIVPSAPSDEEVAEIKERTGRVVDPIAIAKTDIENMNKAVGEPRRVDPRHRRLSWEIAVPVPTETQTRQR